MSYLVEALEEIDRVALDAITTTVTDEVSADRAFRIIRTHVIEIMEAMAAALETFEVPPCPDSVTHVKDENGRTWRRKPGTDTWTKCEDLFNLIIPADSLSWGGLLARGPVTRIPPPPVTIPAERFDVAEATRRYRAAYGVAAGEPRLCEAGVKAVLEYLRYGVNE